MQECSSLNSLLLRKHLTLLCLSIIMKFFKTCTFLKTTALTTLLTVDSGTPRHPAWSCTIHCTALHIQSELLGTVENTVFAGRWCGVCPTRCISVESYIIHKWQKRVLRGPLLPRPVVPTIRCQMTPSWRHPAASCHLVAASDHSQLPTAMIDNDRQ